LEDAELRELIARMKLRMLEDLSSSRRCCRLGKRLEPGQDLLEARDLADILSKCRVAVVMFYSPTCPYCRALTPIFLMMASEYGDKAAFIRVNVYRYPQLASYFNVMGVPTVLLFAGGRPVTGFSGLVDPDSFENIVKETLSKAGCPVS